MSLSDSGPTGPYVAGVPVGPDGRHVSLTMLARLAGMLLLALGVRLGRCPHLTVTLLARLAHMLQGALLAQM